jgi:Tol biopolymer transport system component
MDMSLKHRLIKWGGAGIAFGATVLTAAGCANGPCIHGRYACHGACAPAIDGPKTPATDGLDATEPATRFIASQGSASAAPTRVVNVFGEFNGVRHQGQHAAPAEAGFQQHTATEDGYDADVTSDPSGKWLAFSSTRHSEHSDIYLKRCDGTSVIQLTADNADDVHPCFSPDGRRIAFASTRSGNWDLYVMDIDGRNVEQVTTGPSQEMHPSFSPDGHRLVYAALSPRNDQWELWVIDLPTGAKRLVGQGLFPTWSPRKDVDRIAFQRARQRGSRWFSLWTIDLVNGEPRRLTEVAASSNAAIVSPAWSPDGMRLAFTTIIDPNTPDTNQPTGCNDVWIVDADGRSRQRITNGFGLNLGPHWSPDNRLYFISDRSGQENVWSVHVDPSKAGTATANTLEP